MGQANLLSQADFDTYTASWVDAVNVGGLPVLTPLFENASRLLAATLPTDQLMQLLSAVGVRRIKVGFVVQPTAPTGESAFTLALYATDAKDSRLTAYYLTSTLWATTTATGTPPAPVPGCGTPVPPTLAELWQQQWTAASLEPKLFIVPDGVLQGYDFEVGDFVQALRAVPNPTDTALRFDFGVHEFYGPTAPASPDPTRTFGLAMFMVDKQNDTASAPYDMSMPRPPAT